MKSKKLSKAKTLLIVVFLITVSSCQNQNEFVSGKEGREMPSFNILLTDSVTKFNTNGIRSGKPSILLWLSPTCPYSKLQAKEIVDNYEKLKDVQILAFTVSPISKTKKFAEAAGLLNLKEVVVGIDEGYVFGSYINATAVPTTAIFDENKKLRKVFEGLVNYREINQALK